MKINDVTQKMFNIFQNVYNKYQSAKFEIVDYNQNIFSEEVVKSVVEIYLTYREKES